MKKIFFWLLLLAILQLSLVNARTIIKSPSMEPTIIAPVETLETIHDATDEMHPETVPKTAEPYPTYHETHEMHPETVPKTTEPEPTYHETHVMHQETTHDVTHEMHQETTPETTQETTYDVTHEMHQETTPETTQETTYDITHEIPHETTPETTSPETTSPETTTEITTDLIIERTTDSTPETIRDTTGKIIGNVTKPTIILTKPTRILTKPLPSTTGKIIGNVTKPTLILTKPTIILTKPLPSTTGKPTRILTKPLPSTTGKPTRILTKPISDQTRIVVDPTVQIHSEDNMKCKNSSFCFGHGDPHYRSFHGHKFNINDRCSYLLSTDGCDGKVGSYQIYVNHEYLNENQKASYIKSIVIRIGKDKFEIDNELRVNGVKKNIPFNPRSHSADKKIEIYRRGIYIVFDTNKFNIQFDGSRFLKFRQCDSPVCGICDLKNSEFNTLLNYLQPGNSRACLV